jgi:hypothetical protein
VHQFKVTDRCGCAGFGGSGRLRRAVERIAAGELSDEGDPGAV